MREIRGIYECRCDERLQTTLLTLGSPFFLFSPKKNKKKPTKGSSCQLKQKAPSRHPVGCFLPQLTRASFDVRRRRVRLCSACCGECRPSCDTHRDKILFFSRSSCRLMIALQNGHILELTAPDYLQVTPATHALCLLYGQELAGGHSA